MLPIATGRNTWGQIDPKLLRLIFKLFHGLLLPFTSLLTHYLLKQTLIPPKLIIS